jgi:hypothetical protein
MHALLSHILPHRHDHGHPVPRRGRPGQARHPGNAARTGPPQAITAVTGQQAAWALADAAGGEAAAIETCVRPLTLVPPKLGLSELGDGAVTLDAVELALTDAQQRLLPAPAMR